MRALHLRPAKRSDRLAAMGGDLAFWLVVAVVFAAVGALMWGTATTAY
ncbi:hypothetical protein [Phenylobacterium sp.]|nr:hypothetical protein [Phenylobacterium sp.]HLZ74567.1 hypothetical protein [Phenylobacterium sp.]